MNTKITHHIPPRSKKEPDVKHLPPNVAWELTEQAKDDPPELQEDKYHAAISRAYYMASH